MKCCKKSLLLGLATLSAAAVFGSAAPQASAQVVNTPPCKTQVWAMIVPGTLTGFFECTPRYDWTLQKSVCPGTIIVPPATDPTVTYTLKACRTRLPDFCRIGLRGHLHLLNETACPTQGLNIVIVITYTDVRGIKRTITTAPQIVPDLGPNMDGKGNDVEAVPFEVTICQGQLADCQPGTNYHYLIMARTANQLLPFANKDPQDDFSVPPFPANLPPIDACATVVDPVASLPGFTVKSNAPIAWNLSDANLDSTGCATMSFQEDFLNCSVPCGKCIYVTNCAVLTKCNNIADVRTATAVLTISTGPCASDCDKGKDCDKDKGKDCDKSKDCDKDKDKGKDCDKDNGKDKGKDCGKGGK